MDKKWMLAFSILLVFTAIVHPASALNTITSDYRIYPSDIMPGIKGYVEITLKNDGNGQIEDVEIFRIDSDRAIAVEDYRKNVGDIAPGLSKKIILKFRVSDDAEAGYYLLDVFLTMKVLGSAERYEFQIPVAVRESNNLKLTVFPDRIEYDTPVNLTLRIENGAGNIRNLRIVWSSDGIVPLSENSDIFVRALNQGEAEDFNLRVKAVKPGTSILTFNLTYRDQTGNSVSETRKIALDAVAKREGYLQVSLRPAPLEIGKKGKITLDLEVNGDEPMKNVLIRWKSDAVMPSASDSEFIEILEPRKKVSVQFDVSVNEDVNPGYYPIDVGVRYDYSGTRISREESFSVMITGDIALTSTLFRAENDKVFISIANTGNAPAKNLVVYASSDYGKGEIFIGDMDPGDEEIIEIDQRGVDTSKPYSISLTLDYRDVFGEKYSEVQEVEVHHFSQSSASMLFAVLGVVLAVIIAGIWMHRKK